MTERLLEHLKRHANHRGLVVASESRLLQELRTTHETLLASVVALESEGAIAVLAPLPFLVCRLRSWSGSSTARVRKEQQTSSNPASVHIEVPVSSSFAAAAAIHTEDGGAGEGEALLTEVLKVLGPSADREEFRRMLARYSPPLIRRCLGRVRATSTIRVSRAALFRSLLQRLSR